MTLTLNQSACFPLPSLEFTQMLKLTMEDGTVPGSELNDTISGAAPKFPIRLSWFILVDERIDDGLRRTMVL